MFMKDPPANIMVRAASGAGDGSACRRVSRRGRFPMPVASAARAALSRTSHPHRCVSTVQVSPDPKNIRNMHFVILGAECSPYEGACRCCLLVLIGVVGTLGRSSHR